MECSECNSLARRSINFLYIRHIKNDGPVTLNDERRRGFCQNKMLRTLR
jgi:hypothetical protein